MATIKLTYAQYNCEGEWDPICVGRGPVSESGEVMFFQSKCHLKAFNMQYPKRRKYC